MSNSYSTQLAYAWQHLFQADPVLRKLMKCIGPCTLRREPNRFRALTRSIIAQQISTRAAQSVYMRLEQTLGSSGITPAAIIAASPTELRMAGLSSNKARALKDLAEKVHSGEVPLPRLHRWTDDKVVSALVPVRGIGRWTAEMFLIFSLGRLDVLPVADLGLRAAVRRHYDLAALPTAEELHELARPWQPYRSIATWYFWRSLGFVPQSGAPTERTRKTGITQSVARSHKG